MAGDWTPIEAATPRKPEVLTIASLTGLDRHTVLGWLVEIWAWAGEQTADGRVNANVGALVDALESHLGAQAAHKSVLRAMLQVGWLEDHGEFVVFPNAEHWITRGAKGRLAKNVRQKRWRGTKPNVDASVDADVDGRAPTKAPTTEQNRTVEILRRARPGGAGGDDGQGDGGASTKTTHLETAVAMLWPSLLAGDPKKLHTLVKEFEMIGATPVALSAAKARGDKEYTSPPGPDAILRRWRDLQPTKTAEQGVNNYTPPSDAEQDRVYQALEADRKAKEEYASKNGTKLAPPGNVNMTEVLTKKPKGRK